MDSTLSSAEADSHHHSDLVLLGPNDLVHAVETVSRLAQEVARDASDRRTRMPDSALLRMRMGEQQHEAALGPAAIDKGQVGRNRPLLGRRAGRTVASFVLATCIGVAGTLALQPYGDLIKQAIASWAPQLGWVASLVGTNAPELASKRTPPSIEAAAAATPEPAPFAQTPSEAAARSPELAPQQLNASDLATLRQRVEQLMAQQEQMVRDIAARDLVSLQQSVEQLAARQEQMAREISELQTAEAGIRRKISAPPPRPDTASARKRISTAPRLGRALQLSPMNIRP